MTVLDVFSYLSAIELSIEQFENIFLKSCDGVINDTSTVVHALPDEKNWMPMAVSCLTLKY